MLQRVPFAESGCKERYFEQSKFPYRNRITPRSCIPTALFDSAETMMGAPITAQEYRWLSVLIKAYVVRYRRTKVAPRIFNPSLETGTDFFVLKFLSHAKYISKGRMKHEQDKYQNQNIVRRAGNTDGAGGNCPGVDS